MKPLLPLILRLLAVVAGCAAILAVAFLFYAVEALERAPLVSMARSSPLADIGIAIGVVLIGVGVLLASIRYATLPVRRMISEPEAKQGRQKIGQ